MLVEAADAINSEVLNSPCGKRVGSSRYCHSSLVPPALVQFLVDELGNSRHHVRQEDVVFRVDRRAGRLAVLHYPDFATTAHPPLCCVRRIDLLTGSVNANSYLQSSSRPILHRKELLVDPSHPLYNSFARLTRQEVAAGLFAEPKRIGWSNRWEDLLRSKGLRIEGHELKSTDAGD